MIDFDDLSDQEIAQLEKQLAEYRKSERALKGYKVTFTFMYNPNFHKGSVYEALDDPDSLAEEMLNILAPEIEGRFSLKSPEMVGGFAVVPLSKIEIKEFITSSN